ncbi:MAG TPA: type II secretion system protein N [Gammaproteobacteria bacterium]|jgi:hypothetical protein|nr:type II secretion system protein N [Gammaproteobacteria bacterium]
MNIYQRHSIIICILLVATLVALVIFSLHRWRADWQLAHPQPMPIKVSASSHNAALLTAAENLFGQSPTDTSRTFFSHLPFQLLGIVKADDNAKTSSKAYISTTKGISKIYQIGDMLPYGMKIYAITAHAVIVENDGHLESLSLQRRKLTFKSSIAA